MSQFIIVDHSISVIKDTILVTINNSSRQDPGFLKILAGKL